MFTAFRLFIKFWNKYSWEFRHGDTALLFRLMDYIFSYYRWELRSESPIEHLLDRADSFRDTVRTLKEHHLFDIEQQEIRIEELKKIISRCELEVIHLKDLVQAKDKVIDNMTVHMQGIDALRADIKKLEQERDKFEGLCGP